jgi:hypothetical protein
MINKLLVKNKSTEAGEFDQDYLIIRNESLDREEEHDLEWFSHMNLETRSFLGLGTCTCTATGVTRAEHDGCGRCAFRLLSPRSLYLVQLL